MGARKQSRKLLKVVQSASSCSSREEAQKILKKAAKIYEKLESYSSR